MRKRGSFVRFLWLPGLVLAGVLAVIGGVSLPPPGLVAVGLVAATVACLAAGGLRECRPNRQQSAVEAAVLAAGGTVGVALVFSGMVAVLGGPLAVLLASGAVVAALAFGYRRGPAPPRRGRPGRTGAAEGRPAAKPDRPASVAQPLLRPAGNLTTSALGREWLLSSSALGVPLDAGARQAIVRRRQELLDELERRDPAGFARWIAAGPQPGSDPADFLRGGAAADKDAA